MKLGNKVKRSENKHKFALEKHSARPMQSAGSLYCFSLLISSKIKLFHKVSTSLYDRCYWDQRTSMVTRGKRLVDKSKEENKQYIEFQLQNMYIMLVINNFCCVLI